MWYAKSCSGTVKRIGVNNGSAFGTVNNVDVSGGWRRDTTALGTLSAFRWIEARLPTETYAIFMVRYARDNAITEPALRSLVQAHGFSLHNLSYRLHSDAGQMEYRMVLRTMDAGNARTLAEKLKADPAVLDFRIAPTSD